MLFGGGRGGLYKLLNFGLFVLKIGEWTGDI